MSTPESIAEIGAGADGCASGSQAWNGTIAAFSASPPIRAAAASRTAGPVAPTFGSSDATIAMFRCPVTE